MSVFVGACGLLMYFFGLCTCLRISTLSLHVGHVSNRSAAEQNAEYDWWSAVCREECLCKGNSQPWMIYTVCFPVIISCSIITLYGFTHWKPGVIGVAGKQSEIKDRIERDSVVKSRIMQAVRAVLWYLCRKHRVRIWSHLFMVPHQHFPSNFYYKYYYFQPYLTSHAGNYFVSGRIIGKELNPKESHQNGGRKPQGDNTTQSVITA